MQGGYKQYCPVAMTAEFLCTRWTILVVRELTAGPARFNDLRRGLPRMSPALLSRRLKELEQGGIVERRRSGQSGVNEYLLTDQGRELEAVVMAVGRWGHRWIESEVALKNVDVELLMWDMHRKLDPAPLPKRRVTIQLLFSGVPQKQRRWWLVVTPGHGADLCHVEPGYDVDLYVATDLKSMTAIWMGYDTVRAAVRDGRLKLTGDRKLAADMQTWLGLSPLAKEMRMVA